MSLTLRVATTEDVALLLPLVRAYHEFEGVRMDDGTRQAVVLPLLGQSVLGRVWLVLEDGAVAGYIALCFGYSIEFGGRDAFVDEFFITEPQRGRGLGRGVLALAIEEAGTLGVRALHLEMARTNSRARRLYASAGFELREGFHLMSRKTADRSGTPTSGGTSTS